MGDSNPDIASLIQSVFDEWTNRRAKVVSEAQQVGQIRTDILSTVLAKYIIASIEGGIMMSRLKKDEGPLRECLENLRVTLNLKMDSYSRSSP